MPRRSLCLAASPPALVGCTRDEDYMDVFREQLAANKELADILATVKTRNRWPTPSRHSKSAHAVRGDRQEGRALPTAAAEVVSA